MLSIEWGKGNVKLIGIGGRTLKAAVFGGDQNKICLPILLDTCKNKELKLHQLLNHHVKLEEIGEAIQLLKQPDCVKYKNKSNALFGLMRKGLSLASFLSCGFTSGFGAAWLFMEVGCKGLRDWDRQEPFCLCTRGPISVRPEETFARLRYLLGGLRPMETVYLRLSLGL
ncbi:hypothetical protein WN944_019645 [Citrus x changshan-huyou]|uniref:Uncharacterized protein n=1 Tax=Citrus x changshan-huyou TaxID=2935761 RepID=A0AAP0M0B6_9ROSI